MKFRDLPVGEYFRHQNGTGKFLKTETGSIVIEPLEGLKLPFVAVPVGEEAGFNRSAEITPYLD